jgi:hypothetical protein
MPDHARYPLREAGSRAIPDRLDLLEKRSIEGQASRLRLGMLMAIMGIVLFLLFCYVVLQSYEGRLHIRDSVVQGCERTKTRNIAEAAYKDVVAQSSTSAEVRGAAKASAEAIRQSTPKDCGEAYPAPTLAPWKG